MKPVFVVMIACLGFVLATGAEQPKKEVTKEPAGPVVNGLKLTLSADKTETSFLRTARPGSPLRSS